MSVPVVPSKSADRTAADADTELAWPPPEDQRFALDVMDLQTRRVMTAGEAATELSPLADESAAPPRDAAPRPIPFVASTPIKLTGRLPDADPLNPAAMPASSPAPGRRLALPVLMRAAVAVIVVQAIVIAVFLIRGRALREPLPASATVRGAAQPLGAQAPAVDAARAAAPASPPVLPRAVDTRGRLLVRSDPPGAVVAVDGQRRGATPLAVEELAAGGHRVQLGTGGTTIEQAVTIEAGSTTTLVVPMQGPAAPGPAAGWLNVAAPIEVQVLENGRALGTSSEGPLRLAPGSHKLQLVNETLGYHGQETVTIRAGEMMRLRPSLPDGLLHVNAQPWANVLIDGQRIGDTPLANIKVTLGQHEIRFRHPSLGEQVRQVVVSAGEPSRVSVNMKP
jgi:hypothetical protein